MNKCLTMLVILIMASSLESMAATSPEDRIKKINTFQDSVKNYKEKNTERDLLKKLILAEARSEGTLGMAVVARSILNRHALINTPGIKHRGTPVKPGTFNARGKSLTDIIMAKGQYTPIKDGSINEPRTKEELLQAEEAINMAKDTRLLMQNLVDDREQKFSSGSPDYRENMKEIMTLIESTGFRNPSLTFENTSQAANMTRFGNHVFTTIANPYIDENFLSEEEQRNAKPEYALPQPVR